MSENQIATQGKKMTFSQIISTGDYKKAISNALQDPKRAQRFVAAITSAVSVNPALQACEPKSVLSGALLGESLGLSPSPQLGQYYLVPFKMKAKKDKETGNIIPETTVAVFQLGYKGLVQLALRSGYYKRLNVMAVKHGELVKFNPLTEEIELNLIQDDIERDKTPTIGYVAMFEYLNGFQKTIYWSRDKMIAHADRYSQAFSKEAVTGKFTKVSFEDYCNGNYPSDDEWKYSSYWYKDFDGMAYKTMLRQLISKWGVMSTELQTAFENDETEAKEDYSDELIVVLPASDEPISKEPEGQVSLKDV